MSQVPASSGPLEPGARPPGDHGSPAELPHADAAPRSAGAPGSADADALEERARAAVRADRVIGLLIIAVGFCLALMISWWAALKALPPTSQPPAPPSSAGLQGFPGDVDPLQALVIARSLTRRSLLREIVIEGAKSSGTVDVSAASSRLRYTFQDTAGEGAQPPREPRTLARRHYCGRQAVTITRDGIGAEPDVAGVACQNPPVEPLPEPRCGPRDVWQHALRKGAPASRLARIEYYRSQVGPAWRFVMNGPSVLFSVDGECVREVQPADARSVAY